MVEIKEQEFKRFSEYIKANFGIHFRNEKASLIAGRLNSVIESMHLKSLDEYLDYVLADKSGQALTTMLDKITTNYTYFMREPEHFYYFRDKVLPFLEKTVKSRDLRIWSAACSTGEEPYTLAMITDEYFALDKPLWDAKILASDLSQSALTFAKAGVYDCEKTKMLPENWKRRYFKQHPEGCMLGDKIRNEVVFGNINLMQPFSFKKKMHVIFCRNVMIYFDNETKEKLVDRFYDITEPGGFLFVGHSEGLNRDTTRYKYIMPAVYRKE